VRHLLAGDASVHGGEFLIGGDLGRFQFHHFAEPAVVPGLSYAVDKVVADGQALSLGRVGAQQRAADVLLTEIVEGFLGVG
jgi:hypothetical protein